VVHRVVPNFVIQDGCPRGDGVGGPAFTIGSELGPLYYEEGSVGMASAGKDTEGSQWFITHSPTPHLDGRYTIFAKVVEGMDVVHKIEIGDKILGFEFQ
jgi:cyclophilin family peptidyl-prolyl cis-trans isomerase